MPNWCRLAMQIARFAWLRAFCREDNSNATSTAMMAMTINSSISVNAASLGSLGCFTWFLSPSPSKHEQPTYRQQRQCCRLGDRRGQDHVVAAAARVADVEIGVVAKPGSVDETALWQSSEGAADGVGSVIVDDRELLPRGG